LKIFAPLSVFIALPAQVYQMFNMNHVRVKFTPATNMTPVSLVWLSLLMLFLNIIIKL